MKYDEAVVRQYQREMMNGAEFPPILVGALQKSPETIRAMNASGDFVVDDLAPDRGRSHYLILIDGRHRVEASRAISGEIEAQVVSISSVECARYLAFAPNRGHGLRLTAKEMRAEFDAYIDAGMYLDGERLKSAREIGRELRIDHKTVLSRLRKSAPEIAAMMANAGEEFGPPPDALELARLRDERLVRDAMATATSAMEVALSAMERFQDAMTPLDRVALVRKAEALLNAAKADPKGVVGKPDLSLYLRDPSASPYLDDF